MKEKASLHANLKDPESGAIVTTETEFFDQVKLCLPILANKINILVTEAKYL